MPTLQSINNFGFIFTFTICLVLPIQLLADDGVIDAGSPEAGIIGAGSSEQQADDPSLSISGFIDIGYFSTGNNGKGFTKDVYNRSGMADTSTGIFLGDYASTYINSRGDIADQGEAGAFMPDPIRSGGGPTFIANELYLNFVADLSPKVRVQSALAASPREYGGIDDNLQIELMYAEFRPLNEIDMSIAVGKFDSIVGIEYRWRKSPDRWTVTPSLLSRYTDGTPVGAKVRGKHFDKRFIYNVGITNGSNFIDSTNLNDDIDSNRTPTGSARLSYDFAFGPLSLLELGASGEFGAQSGQIGSTSPIQSTRGFDLQVAIDAVQLRGQYLNLDVEGGGIENAKSYTGNAFYVEAMYSFFNPFSNFVNKISIYSRFGFRQVDEIDTKYIFIIDVMRITGGVRVDFDQNVSLKTEYIHNIENGILLDLDNDVITSSLVVQF